MSKEDELSQIVKDFLVESNEGITTIIQSLTVLEKDPNNEDLVNEIYRAMHTIKGSSCFFQYSKLEKITHILENLLGAIRDDGEKLTSNKVDILLEGTDLIQSYLSTIESTSKGPEGDVESAIKQMETLSEKFGFTLSSDLVLSEKLSKTDLSMEEVVNSDTAPVVEFEKEVVLPEVNLAVEKAVEPEVKEAVSVDLVEPEVLIDLDEGKVTDNITKKKNAGSKVLDSVVRVNVSLLDKIMNVAGELVLNRNQILQFATENDDQDLIRLASQLDIITTELQSDIMTTRMQPVGMVLNKFERLVRDIAKQNNKKVELRIYGKETELDKTLLEAIKDPMTHIIRNSVDHGIELPEDRVKAGKKELGLLEVKAYHESGQVVIEIKDNGKGLSLDKIKAKALSSGVCSSEELSNMTNKQLQKLIFHPGLSTAEKVTSISGRGVGMDVVKNNVEKIGGHVDIDSVAGVGTTLTLKIPLTLAIIPALIVKGQEEFFAIPQNSILELVRIDDSSKQSIEYACDSEFLRLRSELIPIIRLNDLLQLGQENETLEEVQEDNFACKNIVIVNTEGRVYGIHVDDILDTQEIVVKSIGFHNKKESVFAGATIMGDGSVALILDILGVAQASQLQSGTNKEDVDLNDSKNALTDTQSFLLFNLERHSESIYAIPLVLVNRLEEFDSTQVEMIGSQKVVHYRGGIMPLIFTDEQINMKEKELRKNKVYNVFVVNLHKKLYGFVVENILDILELETNVDSSVVDQNNILGSFFHNKRAVTVLDIYSMIDSQEFTKQNQKDIVSEKRKESILVVEDSPMFRKMGVELLKDNGFTVIEAIDGQDGLLKLKENSAIDVVVSDIEMPNMNGFDMACEIKNTEATKHIPMIAVTTKFSDKDIQRGKDSGFKYYLEKFKKEDIISAINSVLQKAG